MSREVLAIDIDEVLFPFMPQFTKYHNAEHGTELTPEDFFCYEFEKVMGLPFDESLARIYKFSGRDYSHVEPIPGSQDATSKLKVDFDLVSVTARHPRFELVTNKWLNLYFPDVFEERRFIGYAPVMEKPVTKLDVCRELGAIALVDDSLGHGATCASGGVEGVLFGNYPWNQAESLPEGVTRCIDWAAVLEHFEKRVVANA